MALEIKSQECRTHPGCRVIYVSERVGKDWVITKLVTNPANQGKRDAERELLEKHADAVAKAKWRDNGPKAREAGAGA